MYTIEKNVPLPAADVGRTRGEITTTLALMEVGDSFLISDASKAARGVAHQYGRAHGRKFATRKVGDGAMRIWRVS